MNLKGVTLQFFMVFVGNCLSAGLKPDGRNVCLKSEIYKETVEVPVKKQLPPVVEFCWRPLKGFRCKKKNEFEIEKVPKEVTRSKIVPTCCAGYRQEGDECLPICENECVNGECVKPNFCSCNAGYQGPDCNETCSDGYWGKSCNNKCECLQGAKCDSVFGCICPPGYKGDRCEISCPEGVYGYLCREKCNCDDQECDKITGDCYTKNSIDKSLWETTTNFVTETPTGKTYHIADTQFYTTTTMMPNTYPPEIYTNRERDTTTGITTDAEAQTSTTETPTFGDKLTTTEASSINAADENTPKIGTTGIGITTTYLETTTEETSIRISDLNIQSTTTTWGSTTDASATVTSTVKDSTTGVSSIYETTTEILQLEEMTTKTSSSLEQNHTVEPTEISTIEIEKTTTDETSTTIVTTNEPETPIPIVEGRIINSHRTVNKRRKSEGEISSVEEIVLENDIDEVRSDPKEEVDLDAESITLSHFIPSLAVVSAVSILIFLIAVRWIVLKHRKRMNKIQQEQKIILQERRRGSSDTTYWVNNCVDNPVYLSELTIESPIPVLRTFKPLSEPEEGLEVSQNGTSQPFPR